MSKGIFYSVGVGPGDPALLTFKAAQTIAACDIVAAPDSGATDNMALQIAAEHIRGKRIITFSMPMTRDTAVMRSCHQQAAEQIGTLLDEGLNVAFLTLGDPTIYSTAMYAHRLLTERGYQTRVIPGIPSFCAAAASLNISLCEGAEPLHILPASYEGDFLELDGAKVLMKSGKALSGILEELRDTQGNEIMLVERASLPEEQVYYSLAEIPAKAGYFSLLVIKTTQQAQAAPTTGLTTVHEYFPLFIAGTGKKVLIAGGGTVAARRVLSLLPFGFVITVVAPTATAEIASLSEQGKINWQQREFCDEDLNGCFFAVAATNKRDVNRHIGELATQNGVWVSVADKRKECSFLFPALAIEGDIVAGIGSGGKNPVATRQAARKIRKALREE